MEKGVKLLPKRLISRCPYIYLYGLGRGGWCLSRRGGGRLGHFSPTQLTSTQLNTFLPRQTITKGIRFVLIRLDDYDISMQLRLA